VRIWGLSKTRAHYRPAPRPEVRCDRCKYMFPPLALGGCRLVRGPVLLARSSRRNVRYIDNRMRLPHKSTQAPQVTLAIAPVIALARSEAMIVAAFATSASSGSRRSKVPLPGSAVYSSRGLPAASA